MLKLGLAEIVQGSALGAEPSAGGIVPVPAGASLGQEKAGVVRDADFLILRKELVLSPGRSGQADDGQEGSAIVAG